MRYSKAAKALPTALLLLAALGVTAARSQSPTPPAELAPQRQEPLPPQQQNPLPGSPEHRRQVDDALKSESGRAGKEEPLPQATVDTRVLVNGALNLPGVSKDSQTEPAKFSAHNATLDKLPTTAARLTDEQRTKIAAALRTGHAPAAAAPAAPTGTTIAQQLAPDVELLELPEALKREVPDVSNLKYVPAGDRYLLVAPRNRIVVAEIKN